MIASDCFTACRSRRRALRSHLTCTYISCVACTVQWIFLPVSTRLRSELLLLNRACGHQKYRSQRSKAMMWWPNWYKVNLCLMNKSNQGGHTEKPFAGHIWSQGMCFSTGQEVPGTRGISGNHVWPALISFYWHPAWPLCALTRFLYFWLRQCYEFSIRIFNQMVELSYWFNEDW